MAEAAVIEGEGESLATEEEATAELFGTEATEEHAEPEAKPEAKAEEVEKPRKLVPLEALHEERKLRKELAEESKQNREKIARMEERFGFIVNSLQGRQQKPAELPDKAADPIGYFEQKTGTLEQRVEAAEKWKQQTEEQGKQRQQFENFMGAYNAKAAEFAEKQQDWPDAYKHFSKSIAADLAIMGVTDPAMIQGQVNQVEQFIVAQAFKDGVNPAERIYAYTKNRGYAAKAAADPGKKLDTVAAGQRASQPMAKAGGSARTEVTTLAQMAELPTKDFNSAWDRLIAEEAYKGN